MGVRAPPTTLGRIAAPALKTVTAMVAASFFVRRRMGLAELRRVSPRAVAVAAPLKTRPAFSQCGPRRRITILKGRKIELRMGLSPLFAPQIGLSPTDPCVVLARRPPPLKLRPPGTAISLDKRPCRVAARFCRPPLSGAVAIGRPTKRHTAWLKARPRPLKAVLRPGRVCLVARRALMITRLVGTLLALV